jgi:hypothetical protein
MIGQKLIVKLQEKPGFLTPEKGLSIDKLGVDNLSCKFKEAYWRLKCWITNGKKNN